MKMKVKILPMDLRSFCIENSLYTCGTCEQYDNLLFELTGDELTALELTEIALDILAHSDAQTVLELYCTETTIEALPLCISHMVNDIGYVRFIA